MGIPPSDDWLAYCLDEALHVLQAGHDSRDLRWDERFRQDAGDGDDLYRSILADPRTGRPPSRQDLQMLEEARQAS